MLWIVATFCVLLVNSAPADIKSFSTFVPRNLQTSYTSSDTYPSQVEAQIEWDGQPYDLVLSVNEDLFAEDWSIETYNDAGELVYENNDRRSQMCHYTGYVRGIENSFVVMSLCDEIGMRGSIYTERFSIETQHAVPLSVPGKKSWFNEQHIIYDLEAVDISGYHYGESQHMPLNATDDVVDVDVADRKKEYHAKAVVASDSSRVNAFSSNNAESQNSQTIMNYANTRYRQTTWNNGHSIRYSIARQVQKPSGWRHSSNMNTNLNNLSSYKKNSHPQQHNLAGFTHHNYGGTIGLAWVNSMCDAYYSTGLNNVGFTSSDSIRGNLVAHEVGHNWSFQHDSDSRGGYGFIMWPSVIQTATKFSSYSRSQFETNRGRFMCL